MVDLVFVVMLNRIVWLCVVAEKATQPVKFDRLIQALPSFRKAEPDRLPLSVEPLG